MIRRVPRLGPPPALMPIRMLLCTHGHDAAFAGFETSFEAPPADAALTPADLPKWAGQVEAGLFRASY